MNAKAGWRVFPGLVRDGTADFVRRREAASTAVRPKCTMAAATADDASYSDDVVTSNWAISDCSWVSVAPYSALPKPPNSTRSPSTVISLARRSPCEIC